MRRLFGLSLASLATAALPAAIVGCSSHTDTSPVSISYDDCPAEEGCASALTSRPLGVGATADLLVTAGEATASIGSDDTSIVTVGSYIDVNDRAHFTITGVAPGSATLVARNADGGALVSATVTVAPIGVVSLAEGIATGGILVLDAAAYEIDASALGAGGTALAGSGGVHFAFTGAVVPFSTTLGCSDECGFFQADGVGSGSIAVSGAPTTQTIPVTVVDPTAIDDLQLAAADASFSITDSESFGESMIHFTLRSNGQIVYGDAIQCTSSDPSLLAVLGTTPVDGVSVLGEASGAVTVQATSPASVTLTCTANGHLAAMLVHAD